MSLIGRKEEQQTLLSLYHSDKSEFVAIYGRRRVGKTFLVAQTFKDAFAFQHTGRSPYEGSSKITMNDQIQAFYYSLIRYGLSEDVPVPKTWIEAFYRLENLLEKKAGTGKRVVFIDELPWMDTPKSKFISAFEGFYNGWASLRDDILLIVCGSSSSWILKNIVRSKGGLYDRFTCQIKLSPFTLRETEEFLSENNVHYDRYDIVRTYMAFGGIPYYLGYLKPGASVEQNIDNAFFKENSPLQGEFVRLFNTLFTGSDKYIKIVRALSKRNYGYTKGEISHITGISAGGGLSEYLENLVETDFVERYKPVLSNARIDYFRLKDSFCLFYLRFIDGKKDLDEHFWQNSSGTKGILSWQGIAFEQVCLTHLESLKKALGIHGITTVASKMIIPSTSDRSGSQIDLVIDRADRNVNLCEMKFYSSDYSVDKEENIRLRNRVENFKTAFHVRGNVFLTLITTFGLKYGVHSSVFQKTLILDDLFL